MQRFASEITELRALGFAESLPIQPLKSTGDVIARLESGRVGVAVEFRGAGSSRYAVQPLIPHAESEPLMASDVWTDIVRDIRRRAPLGDED